MIFVDSNIPMYLVGAAHPHKADAQGLLESAIAAGERLVTDVEVLQEILHRSAFRLRREARAGGGGMERRKARASGVACHVSRMSSR